jgi:Transposase DDE domain
MNVWQHFAGVYLQDSGSLNMPAALAQVWPGCGGGHTRGDGAAALKVQVQWELQRGQLSAVELQAGRAADRTAHGLLAQLPAEALGLADLGYYSLERLAAQAAAGSYWLNRVQAGTGPNQVWSWDTLAPVRKCRCHRVAGPRSGRVLLLVRPVGPVQPLDGRLADRQARGGRPGLTGNLRSSALTRPDRIL